MTPMLRPLLCALGLMLGIASANAAWAQAASTPLARPTTDRRAAGVAVRPAPRPRVSSIPNNNFMAVLFLRNSDAGRRICDTIDGRFSFSPPGDADLSHDRYIVFATTKDIADRRLPCARLRDFYSFDIWADFDDYLRIVDRGDGPFVFIIFRQANGTYTNCGYVDFSRVDPARMSATLDMLDTYYRRGPAHWLEDHRVWEPSDNGILAAIGNTIGLGDRPCIKAR